MRRVGAKCSYGCMGAALNSVPPLLSLQPESSSVCLGWELVLKTCFEWRHQAEKRTYRFFNDVFFPLSCCAG